MKTATLKIEPSPADLLANARQTRDTAREHVTAMQNKAARVCGLHARLQAAQ